jgi:Ca2+-binding RTX toxin-like protein
VSFLGDSGANTLTGTSSAENFVAGQGNDTINGGGGNDVIRAGAGNDALRGGSGSDVLRGGSGSDVFDYAATSDGGAVSSNQTASAAGVTGDRIQDFVSGTDEFNFLQSAFGNLSTGALTNGASFSSINNPYDGTNPGTNSNFNAGNSTFIFDSTDTLYYDANGSSAGYTVIATTLGTNIVAADLEIVSSL